MTRCDGGRNSVTARLDVVCALEYCAVLFLDLGLFCSIANDGGRALSLDDDLDGLVLNSKVMPIPGDGRD